MEIILVDEAVSVLIYHVEGLLELLYLRLVKHGEHITGGTLCPLLHGLLTSLAGRHNA